MVKSFIVKESHLELVAGETVYICKKYDYGSAEDDTELLGTRCVSVTRDENGDYPFFTIPYNKLQDDSCLS